MPWICAGRLFGPVYRYLSPFGESKKFPLLGPAVTAITVSAVTVISFISGDGVLDFETAG